MKKQGPEIKKVEINTVKFRNHVFALRTLENKDRAKIVNGGLNPAQMVNEYRKAHVELSDRLHLVLSILAVTLAEGPEVGKSFMESVGVHVSDINGEIVYTSPEPKKEPGA